VRLCTFTTQPIIAVVGIRRVYSTGESLFEVNIESVTSLVSDEQPTLESTGL